MKNFLFTIFFINIIFIINCNHKKESPVTENQKQTNKQIKLIPFQPPQDSSIIFEQMESWLVSNPLLDSLAIMYCDSFKTEDPKLRMRYQKDFSTAQDKICILSGLSGGFVEYKWILANMAIPKNKPLMDSLSIETY